MKTFQAKKHRDYFELLREPNLLEDLGVLVDGKGLEFSVIQKSLGELVVERWARWRPTIEWMRGDPPDKSIYQYFELMAVAIAFPATKQGWSLTKYW